MARKRLLPRYVKWRDGRPRWELGGQGGMKLRKAGWQSVDLKDADGAWLNFEQAHKAGTALNEAVTAWRAGDIAPDKDTLKSLIASAPDAIARTTTQTPNGTARFTARPASKAHQTFDDLIAAHMDWLRTSDTAQGTRDNYARRARTLNIWIGHLRPAQITAQGAWRIYQTLIDVGFWKGQQRARGHAVRDGHPDVKALSLARKEDLREQRIEALDDVDDPRDQPGFTMAHDIMVYARMLWNYARKYQGLNLPNVFEDVDLKSPRGRVRFIEGAEAEHLVTLADTHGDLDPYFGDMVIMALQTVQRGSDLIRLTWQDFDRGRFNITQQKRGKPVRPAVTDTLRRRAQDMRQRQANLLGLADPKQVIGPMLRNAKGEHFTHRGQLTNAYGRLRAIAAETMPSLKDSKLHDMRDTGFTRVYLGTFDLVRACEQSGHSIKSGDMIVKAYLASHPQIADKAAEGYDEWMTSNGVKW